MSIAEFIVAFVLAFVCALVFWIFDEPLKSLANKAVNYWSSINKAYSDKIFLDMARKYRHGYNLVNAKILDLWNTAGLGSLCMLAWLFSLPADRDYIPRVAVAISDAASKVTGPLHIGMIGALVFTLATLFMLINNSLQLGRARKINGYIDVFEQEMCGLRPFIGEEKIIELQSKWALMKNEEDWEIINTEIESLKGFHGLKFC